MQFSVTNPVMTLPPGCCYIQGTQIFGEEDPKRGAAAPLQLLHSVLLVVVNEQFPADQILLWVCSSPTTSTVRQCEECHGNALALLKCCWLVPLEKSSKSHRGVWGQSLVLQTGETQHHSCSWFVLLALQDPSIISTWQQLQAVKQGWSCNIPL